jgi:microcystin-dependent protein
MSDPFLGEMRMIAWNYPPRFWAFCDGALMAINTNQALFALLGTTYGGDGVRTYQLPDLRARTPMGSSTAVPAAAVLGVPSYALLATDIPVHMHMVQVAKDAGTQAALGIGVTLGGFANGYGPNPGVGKTSNLEPTDISPAGTSTPHENRQPFQCINFVIALSGIFPSRN